MFPKEQTKISLQGSIQFKRRRKVDLSIFKGEEKAGESKASQE